MGPTPAVKFTHVSNSKHCVFRQEAGKQFKEYKLVVCLKKIIKGFLKSLQQGLLSNVNIGSIILNYLLNIGYLNKKDFFFPT